MQSGAGKSAFVWERSNISPWSHWSLFPFLQTRACLWIPFFRADCPCVRPRYDSFRWKPLVFIPSHCFLFGPSSLVLIHSNNRPSSLPASFPLLCARSRSCSALLLSHFTRCCTTGGSHSDVHQSPTRRWCETSAGSCSIEVSSRSVERWRSTTWLCIFWDTECSLMQ